MQLWIYAIFPTVSYNTPIVLVAPLSFIKFTNHLFADFDLQSPSDLTFITRGHDLFLWCRSSRQIGNGPARRNIGGHNFRNQAGRDNWWNSRVPVPKRRKLYWWLVPAIGAFFASSFLLLDIKRGRKAGIEPQIIPTQSSMLYYVCQHPTYHNWIGVERTVPIDRAEQWPLLKRHSISTNGGSKTPDGLRLTDSIRIFGEQIL